MDKVQGIITAEKSITASLNNSGAIVAAIQGNGSLPEYSGAYEVIPQTVPQTLHTSNRTMAGDVVVLDIPYQEVLNLSGGKTATIG